MSVDTSRLAHIFCWREGTAPDLDYARQVIAAANPAASEAMSKQDVPLTLLGVAGVWPDEPWAQVVADLRRLPAPEGTRWDDTTRYDLAGWQGADVRTGQRLFVVFAYRRVTPSEAFTGQSVGAPHVPAGPSLAVPQIPYDPQQPTGPLAWPPMPQVTPTTGQLAIPHPPAHTYGYAGQPHYPGYLTDPLVTVPTAVAPGDVSAPLPAGHGRAALFQSYAPFYTGFVPRLVAGLIDFFFMSLLQIGPVAGVLWRGSSVQPSYFLDWLGGYGVFICLGLVTFVAYHVVQWTVWGQTLGKRLVGIKIVQADGHKPTLGSALLRMAGYFFSLSLGGWGFIIIALDPRRQALHDKIAGTFVTPESPSVPAPPGLPGYIPPAVLTAPPAPGGAGWQATSSLTTHLTGSLTPTSPIGMAVVAGVEPAPINVTTSLEEAQVTPVALEPSVGIEVSEMEDRISTILTSVIGEGEGITPGPVTDMRLSAGRQRPNLAEQAGELFRRGLARLEAGAEPGAGGYKVEVGAARSAAAALHQAVELAPSSVIYRYFYAVALRYSEGFEVALGEFRQVLELDPSHYEARQQVAYGARWHDAFAYPAWVAPAPVEVGAPMPQEIMRLLDGGGEPATRLVLLREGGNKMAAFLSRTPRDSWAAPPMPEMRARLHLYLNRTSHGPIIGLYIVVEDDPQNPFIGETFLNPHDPGYLSDDACLMGQHLLEQLARQDRTYLIFADEEGRLLLSRKLSFDVATQVNLQRTLFEVQSLPAQVMDLERFRLAAEWHMGNFPLDQVRSALSG